jgi:hypothetical protein
MSDDNDNDPPLPTPEPVAWMAHSGDSRYVAELKEMAAAAAAEFNWDLAPLYLSPTLTDEEREAIEAAAWACGRCDGFNGDPRKPALYKGNQVEAMLRGLLERTNRDAVPEAIANADGEPAPECGGEAGLSSRDGTGNTPSKAEIDALEFVVEEGRIGNYGTLRSWLIRLRPEWESQSYEESDEKRVNTTTNRDTTHGEGSVRGEGTVGERLVGRLSITQAMLADNEKLRAEIARLRLTDEEREAIELSISKRLDLDAIYTLRKLLERLS